jgi:hypothetical protein
MEAARGSRGIMQDSDFPEFSRPSRFTSWTRYLSLARLGRVLTQSSSNRGFERYRRVGITASSSFVAKALNILISFLSVPLTIHYLGSERYGVWLTISSLLTWMALTDFGLSGNALVNVLADLYQPDFGTCRRHSFPLDLVASGLSDFGRDVDS